MTGPSDLASGATTSSEGTWLVCRLPLAAFNPSTSGVKPRRPAAVIQYDNKDPGTQSHHRLFSGASDHRWVNHLPWLGCC